MRRRLGLTQADFADLLGVSFVTVNRWERGKTRPSERAVKRLRAAATGQLGRQIEPANRNDAAEATRADPGVVDFLGDPRTVRLCVEAERLSYGHVASPSFATETSRIEPLPHQRIAVYERMLTQPRLRFLLADDAGAGKTIMAGLYIREMQARRLIRRVLIVPPAGLIGNWERELRRLFGMRFRIVRGPDAKAENPFAGPGSDTVICNLDTLRSGPMFTRLQDPIVEPYDLVVVDEAHKLAASRDADLTVRKTDRYKLGEALAGVTADDPQWALPWSARHLLLLTATPHMGKDYPYYALWRLLEPELLAADDAFRAFPPEERRTRFIRRAKEEMVRFDGSPLYPQRITDTIGFDLTQGEVSEQELYDRTTAYMRGFYNRAGILSSSAARLALGVFQRRLASSTHALMRSFERRLAKLDHIIQQLQEGRLTDRQIRAAQRHLFDPFEHSTADEEAGQDGRESHEDDEDRLVRLIRTTSLADLQLERDEVRSLLDLARRVLAEGNESKFSKLREFLLKPEYRREKLIIFTEHRDTLAWLLQGLEGMGFTDRIAAIHGGLDFRDREAEVEHFKRATADGGAQYLLATDAAGEGINLQFCWLMVNYDVPWNPARLEQRLGRIHRYGQEHDPVVIINLIANNTREGLVIGTLLRKLEVMRRELRSDKVFDVVGRIFENVSIARYMTDALVDDAATQTARRLEGQLTREQFDALEQRERVLFGEGGDVTQQLPRLRQVTEREALRKLLPGYVRQFVHGAADVLRLGIDGDLDGCFSLKPLQRGVLDPVWEALEDYPPDLRRRLTVYRPKHEEAVFLHPGEPVFERLRRVVLERSAPDRLRGAAFTDPTARDPYLIFVAELSLVRRADAGRDTPLHSRLVAVKVNPDATLALCPVEHFLLLDGCDRFPTEFVQLASRAEEFEERVEHHLRDKVATPLVTERQYELRRDLPSREALLVRGFDFQLADLVAARQRLTEKARQGDARAMTDLERIKTQQRALDRRKAESVAELHAEPDRIAIGGVSVFARALVVPSTSEADRERYDADVEAIAMQVARAYEEAAGAAVHDVSTPPKARAAGLTDYPGFDLLATYPTGERRAIEVKGRSRRGDIEVKTNEWARACNLREEYWLHVVFDCVSPAPRLVRVQDPFMKLLARSRSVALNAADILEAGESGWVTPPTASPLPEILRSVFWDHAFDELRWPTHRDLVIGRVLQSGGSDAVGWLRKRVGDLELAAWLQGHQGRGLDPRQLRFWQVALDLPRADVDRWVKEARDSAWGSRGAP